MEWSRWRLCVFVVREVNESMSKKSSFARPIFGQRENPKAVPVSDISGKGPLPSIKCKTANCSGMMIWNVNHEAYECQICDFTCRRNLEPIHR